MLRLDLKTLSIEKLAYQNQSSSDILAITQDGSIYWTDRDVSQKPVQYIVYRYDFNQSVPDTTLVYNLHDPTLDDPWMDVSTETLLWIEDQGKEYRFCRKQVLSDEPECFQSNVLINRNERMIGSAEDNLIYWSFNYSRGKSVTLNYFDFNTQEVELIQTIPNFYVWPFKFVSSHQSSIYWQGQDNIILKSDEQINEVELIDNSSVTIDENSFVFSDNEMYFIGGNASTFDLNLSSLTNRGNASIFLRKVNLESGTGENIFNFPYKEFGYSFGINSLFNFIVDVESKNIYWIEPNRYLRSINIYTEEVSELMTLTPNVKYALLTLTTTH